MSLSPKPLNENAHCKTGMNWRENITLRNNCQDDYRRTWSNPFYFHFPYVLEKGDLLKGRKNWHLSDFIGLIRSYTKLCLPGQKRVRHVADKSGARENSETTVSGLNVHFHCVSFSYYKDKINRKTGWLHQINEKRMDCISKKYIQMELKINPTIYNLLNKYSLHTY